MNAATDAAFYWREFDAALRPMLDIAVVLLAAGMAALTLSGAGRPGLDRPIRCGLCAHPPGLLIKPAPERHTP